MIKVCFFDNDGTILSHTSKKVPSSTRKALALLQQQGIKIVMASGRSIMELEKLDGYDIKYDAYITLNGQLVLDQDLNIIDSLALSTKSMNYFIDCFNNKIFPLVLVGKDKMYVNMVNELVEEALSSVSSSLPQVNTYDGSTIYQVVAYGHDIKAKIAEHLDDVLITYWHQYGVDVVSEGSGKLAAIKRYLKLNQIKDDEWISFGDGENDIEMLKEAKYSIAMGNASDEVKQCATYVTNDIDDDGIYNACCHFGLIKG